ncbi:MAG: response regulator [Rhodospirillales bacterium]|nr:response regulator [Rhodospirillales bacterium]
MKKRVLVVDDSVTMRDMVAYTMKSAGFTVFEADDGLNAIDFLDKQTVDLVITDINMPRLDGVGLIEKLRNSDINRFLPILCLTTETDPNLKNAAKSAGATGWLVKPFDPDVLVRAAHKVCL